MNCDLDGAYRDPDLKPQRHPAAIGDAMLRQINGDGQVDTLERLPISNAA